MQLIQLFQNLVGNAHQVSEHRSPHGARLGRQARRQEMDVFGARTTGWGSTRSISRGSSACSSGCISGRSSPAPVSGWRSARRSSSGMAASISVESQPGQGSTFRFALTGSEREIMKSSEEHDMPIRVLLVEDSPGDVRLTREAFRDANRAVRLHVAGDGVEAMAFLRHEGRTPMPPARISSCWISTCRRMDGREVLAQIKKDDSLKTHPDRHPDHLRGRSGYRHELPAPGELLSQQARPAGRVRKPGQEHQ